MVITLFGFGGSLAKKCVSLNNQLCLTRPTLTDVSPKEFPYYPYFVSVDKCSRSCQAIDDLYAYRCILNIGKNTNIKIFSLMSNFNESRFLAQENLCVCV